MPSPPCVVDLITCYGALRPKWANNRRLNGSLRPVLRLSNCLDLRAVNGAHTAFSDNSVVLLRAIILPWSTG
jgi:hypothetical protein